MAYNGLQTHSNKMAVTLRLCMNVISAPAKFVFPEKIIWLVQQLLKVQKQITDEMYRYIDVYIKMNTTDAKELDNELFCIFGNIEELFEVHKMQLQPKWRNCNENIFLILDVLEEMLLQDEFYCYIKYGLIAEQCFKWQLQYTDKLKSIQDKTNVPFEFHPMTQWKQFKVLLEEIKDGDASDLVVSRCKKVALLIGDLHSRFLDAFMINSLPECSYITVKELLKLHNIMQSEYKVDPVKPSLYLVSRRDSFDCYRAPLNVLEFGKLIRVEANIFIDEYDRGPSPGTYFFFEKCMLMAKIEPDKRLRFHHFFCYTTVTFVHDERGRYAEFPNEYRVYYPDWISEIEEQHKKLKKKDAVPIHSHKNQVMQKFVDSISGAKKNGPMFPHPYTMVHKNNF